jgi:hypothetical protein
MPNVSSPVFSSPIIIERHMIAIHGSNDGSLYYIDMMENSRHKLLSLPQAVFASPAVMRLPRCKKIFVAICCVDGSVYIAELLRNGEAKIIGSYSMSESQIFSSPVAKQDGESTFRLIFGCRNSDKVVCVRVRLG